MNVMKLFSNSTTNFTDLDRQTMGLGPLNEEAFSEMVLCGHRVVSIELEEGSSRLLVNTGCNSREFGSAGCKGFMEFSITPVGANLIKGEFSHFRSCFARQEHHYESLKRIEAIGANNNSYVTIIRNAKKIANSAWLYPGHDYHQPPSESNPISLSNKDVAERVINDLDKFEAQLGIPPDNPGVMNHPAPSGVVSI